MRIFGITIIRDTEFLKKLKEANDRGLRNLRLAESIRRGTILAGYDLEKDLKEIQERKVSY